MRGRRGAIRSGTAVAGGVVLIGAGLALLIASRPWDRAGPALRPVPVPDTEHLDAAARELVARRLEELNAATRREGVDAARRAEAFGAAGIATLATGLDATAEATLANAEALSPEDSRWPYALGHLYERRGETDRAIAAFERARAAAPGDPAATVRLASLLLEADDAGRAEDLYRSALASDPGSASALYGLGRIAAMRGDPERAVALFEQALARSPGATIIHYPLALAYRETGREEEARRHLLLRGEVEPMPYHPVLDRLDTLLPDPGALTERGLAALEAGHFDAAARTLRRVVEIEPHSPVWRLNLGTALARSGDTPAAMAQYREALRLAPGHPDALANIGGLLAGAGERDAAIEHFRRAIEADPAATGARLGLADELQKAGRYDEALEQFDAAAGLDPSSLPARIGAALTLVRLERFGRARQRLEEARRDVPRDPLVAQLLARLLATSPDPTHRDGQRALELIDPHARGGGIDAAETMAMALAELGRFDQAVVWQRRAIESARAEGRGTGALERNLGLYLSGRACRDFWHDP